MLSTSELLQKLIEIQRLRSEPKADVLTPAESSTSQPLTMVYSSTTVNTEAEKRKIAAIQKRAQERKAQQTQIPIMLEELKKELPPNAAPYVDALIIPVTTRADDHLLPNELSSLNPPVSNLGFSLQVYQAILPYAQLAYFIEQNGEPELQAYKLAVIFGNAEAAIKYVQDYSKEHKDDDQPFHNACLFQLPTGGGPDWDILTWRRLANSNQKPMLDAKFRKCISRAREIENKLGDTFNKSTAKDIKNARKTLLYTGVTEETWPIADIFDEEGASQEDFDKYVKEVLPQARKKDMTVNNIAIPDIVFKGAEVGFPGYTIEKLHHLDPMCAMLGHKTGCCQSIGGQGESCVINGITDDQSGFYVLRKGKDIKAQSWAWRGTNGALVLDSIEVQGNVLNGKIGENTGHDLVCAMYQGFAKKLITEQGVDEVRVGTSGQTPDNVGESFAPWSKNSYPQHYTGYRDSRDQRLILDKDSLWLQYIDDFHEDQEELLKYLNTLLIAHPNTNLIKIPAIKNFMLWGMWDDNDAELIGFGDQLETNPERKQQIKSFMEKYHQILGCDQKMLPDLIMTADIPIEALQMPFHSQHIYHFAVNDNNINLINSLIQKGLDPNIRDSKGQSPLILAITQGNDAVVKELIGCQGIDLNFPDNKGNTPLSVAIKFGCNNIALMLIEKDTVDVNADNFDGETMFDLAIEGGHANIVEALTKRKDLQPLNTKAFLRSLSQFMCVYNPDETIQAMMSALIPLFSIIVKDPTQFILWLHPYKIKKTAETIILSLGAALDPLINTPSDYLFVLNCLKAENINKIDFLTQKIGKTFKTSDELIHWLRGLPDRSHATLAMIDTLKEMKYFQNVYQYNELLKLAGRYDSATQCIIDFGPIDYIINTFDELNMILNNIEKDSRYALIKQLGNKIKDIILSREMYEKMCLILPPEAHTYFFDILLDKIPDFPNLNESDVLYFFKILDDEQREKLLMAFGPKIYSHLKLNHVFFHILDFLPMDSRVSFISGIDDKVFAGYFDSGISRAAVLQRLPKNAHAMFFEKLGENIKKMDVIDLFNMLDNTTSESSAIMFKNLGDKAVPLIIEMIQKIQLDKSLFQTGRFMNKIPDKLLEEIQVILDASAMPSTRPRAR